MHHVDRDTPWDEIWQAMEVLVARARSSTSDRPTSRLAHRAGQRHRRCPRFFGLVSEQSIYNLLTREIELEVLPAAIEYGVGVIRGPRSRRLLGAAAEKEREGRRRQAGRGRGHPAPAHGEQIASYEALCDELGEQPAHVALAWLLHTEGVTGPIIGPRTRTAGRRAARDHVHLGEDVLQAARRHLPGYSLLRSITAW